MIKIFQPIFFTSVDWKSFLQVTENNQTNVGKILDTNGIKLETYTAILASIRALEYTNKPFNITEIHQNKHLLKHLNFGFYFILHYDLLFLVSSNTELMITRNTYHADHDYEVGVMSANLVKWVDSIIEAHTIFKNDKMYLKLFNGVYKIFESIGLGKIFSGHEQVINTDNSFTLRKI